MKQLITTILILALTLTTFGQTKTAKDYGYTHLQMDFKGDKVDILVKSRNGDENKKKPIFFFCQGSLPRPLLMPFKQGLSGVFPFNYDSLIVNYHLVIVGKPNIPLIRDVNTLNSNYCYVDNTGSFPKDYTERNLLDYYVDRNIEVIKYLQKQKWVSSTKLILAGHSEGSTVAAKMSTSSHRITHLIYLSGNPLGRIMSIIQRERSQETDSIKSGENMFEYWKDVVGNKDDLHTEGGDTYKATYGFSYPPIEYLQKIKIPVFIGYGTKDWNAPFVDFMRVDFIRKGKNNFQFNAYIGAEHNFDPVVVENKLSNNTCSWDRVANDWMKWLEKK